MSGEGGAIAVVRPSVIRKVVTEALNEAEHNGMARPVTDEWVAIRMLASPALADLLAAERQRGREEALRVVRQVESDMGEQAYEAWRSADARRGLSDHEALLVHADALTRWSERFRMAFDGDYYAAEGDE